MLTQLGLLLVHIYTNRTDGQRNCKIPLCETYQISRLLHEVKSPWKDYVYQPLPARHFDKISSPFPPNWRQFQGDFHQYFSIVRLKFLENWEKVPVNQPWCETFQNVQGNQQSYLKPTVYQEDRLSFSIIWGEIQLFKIRVSMKILPRARNLNFQIIFLRHYLEEHLGMTDTKTIQRFTLYFKTLLTQAVVIWSPYEGGIPFFVFHKHWRWSNCQITAGQVHFPAAVSEKKLSVLV